MLIHTFQTTGEAYDASQCDPNVQCGDLLVIPSEQVVGIAYTWPVAVTFKHGELHYLADGYSFEHFGLEASAHEAFKLAEFLGYPM